MAKLDNKRIMVCCANGAASSLMMKATLQKVLKKHKITPAQLHHCSLSDGKAAAPSFDVVFCARNFAGTFADAQRQGTAVLGIKDIMSDKEMEQALRSASLLD